MTFKPALIIVDVQEDFCPPDGALQVPGGRDIVPVINELLKLPFPLKIATQDWHPEDHISFASNHPPPNNIPFESTITFKNPIDPAEKPQTTRLWPVHCLRGSDGRGSDGAKLVPELNFPKEDKVHRIVKKGEDKRVEMYSAFADPFEKPAVKSDLAKILREENITDVYCTGLAADYCVYYTALHAAEKGFTTWVVKDAQKPVKQENMKEVEETYKQDKYKIKMVSKDEVLQKIKQ
ncbi:pyrazinamidase/nicotinamidase-like protein [Lophiostoma macrostomum CBS 122681]|uniref:nicotinamidase n=1 Tax=Lophiostoma macrostomum CBS 122681 TaxID=1314788 RepID=A0A6A6SU49_9PLEO|nr:pyrazinamidase/nicotinamidase-like protein [Lophiostoma macrostomum CBS 122681]